MEFTLAEAVQVLNPAISERRLRAIIAALPAFTPAGNRHTGRRGHPHPTFKWEDLVKLHAALAPWLEPPRRLAGKHVVQCA